MISLNFQKQSNIYLIGFIAYFIFSIGDTLIKLVGTTYPYTLIFAISTFTGSLPVIIYLIFKKNFQELKTKKYLLHLLRGILMAIVAYSILKGIILLPLSISYPILLSAPVILSFMGIIFLKEKINVYKILSLIIAMLGVFLVSGFSINQGYNFEGILLLGIGAICVAVLDLSVRLYGKNESTLSLSFYSLFISSIIFTILSFGSWTKIAFDDLLLLISGGALDGIGMLILVFSLKRIEASYISITHYSQIIYGLIIGYLVFNHTPSYMELFGGVFVLSSGWLIYLKLNQSN